MCITALFQATPRLRSGLLTRANYSITITHPGLAYTNNVDFNLHRAFGSGSIQILHRYVLVSLVARWFSTFSVDNFVDYMRTDGHDIDVSNIFRN